MFKDPADPSITPYELLGVEVSTPAGQVHAALPRFMRDPKNRPRIPLAQDALKKLKNAQARAAIDLWLYDIDVVDLGGADADDGSWLDAMTSVPLLRVDELCTDLEGADLTADLRDVAPSRMKISDLTSYDDLEAIEVRPLFDVA
jgi:hypothetical protein